MVYALLFVVLLVLFWYAPIMMVSVLSIGIGTAV